MNRKQTLSIASLVLGLLLIVSEPATAQEARFVGRVVDPSGTPIADVKITLRNLDDGQTVEIESDNDGEFFRRALTMGRYELRFEREGYVTVRDERQLRSGQTRHDVTMTPATIQAVGPEASPEYAAAYEAFSAGEREKAIGILTGLVEQAPDFAPGFLLLARSHFELGHWEEAIAGYTRVLELDPALAIAYLDLGVAYAETGRIDEATASFEKSIEMQPEGEEGAEVHYNIGAVYVRADRVDEAIEHLTLATEMDPDHALAHKALAFALVRRSDNEGAIRHLERYLEIAPDAADAAEMRALLEQLRGA